MKKTWKIFAIMVNTKFNAIARNFVSYHINLAPRAIFCLLLIAKRCSGNEVGIMWKIVLSLPNMKGSIPFYWGVQSCRYKVASCKMPFIKVNPHRVLDQIHHKIKPRNLLKKNGYQTAHAESAKFTYKRLSSSEQQPN